MTIALVYLKGQLATRWVERGLLIDVLFELNYASMPKIILLS